MRIIPKFYTGRTPWYSSLQDYDPAKYTHGYDTSKLVNPFNYGDAWASTVNGLGKGRYKPNPSLTKAQVLGIEQGKYYSDFTSALFNPDGTLSTVGQAYAKQSDALLPENSSARVYDSSGNIRSSWVNTNRDTYGRSGLSFNNVLDYLTYKRDDQLAGGRHNVFLNTGNRYFYKDENGEQHWVDPNEISKYNISTDPIKEGWNEDHTVYWKDYELTGLKENPEVSPDNACIQSYMAQGMDEALARAFCQGSGDAKKVINTPEEKKDPGGTISNVYGEGTGEKEGILAGLRGKINGSGIFNPLLLGVLRVAIDNHANIKNIKEYNSHLRPPLLTPWQAHKVVYGDYIAKRLGELQSARLLSMASRPMTSDASLQLAGLLEAAEKGAQQVLAGQQRDAAQYYRTRDDALNLAILNILVRTQVANTNRQLMSQIEQMKAQNIFNAKTLNMLNWDRWASQWEDRALAKYDYNQQRKRNLLEQMDALGDRLGVNDDIYRQKYYEWIEETDPAKKATLELQLIDLKKKNQLQVYRNMGDRIGITWNPTWSKIFEDNHISSIYKNGGILRRLQQGGGLPLVGWTPNMGGAYRLYLALLMSGQSETSSKSSKSSDSDKEETTLLKNIVETLKGADLLSSDMDVLSLLLKKFFDIQRYAPEGLSVDHLYRGYIDALANVDKAKLSANNFKQAYDNTLKNGGLHEAAIDSQGRVYVGVIGTGEMKAVTPTQYLENKDSLRLLTNEDLLYLRQTQPKYAFSDKILTGVVSNGIGMEEVGKFVKEFVGSLGNSKESRDLMVYTFGHLATQGIQVLLDLVRNGFTDEQTAAIMAGGVDGLWQSNIMTESLIQLAKLAQSAILQSLPKNMLSLLTLRAGGTQQAAELVGKIILSGTSTESSFSIEDITALDENGNLKSSTKTGTGGSGSSGEESTDRFLEDVQKGWGASDGVITINPGNQLELTIPSKDYNPIETASPSSLRDALVNSTLWGIGKDNNTKIYFGDQKIPVDKLGDVVYMGEGFSRIILPINSDGSPRFSVFEEVQKILNDLNINLNDLYEGNVPADKVKKFAETLNSKGLRDLVDGSKPDLTKFGVFMVTRGLATPKAGISDQNRFAVLQNNIDRDWYEGILSTKGLDGKILLYETDRPNFWNPAEWDIFGASYDKIYEGTIYIPIALNPEMAVVAGGNKEKPSTAKNREKENQAWKNIQRYSNTPSTDVLQQ